eukprot:Filipodium_phascolosomae@DN6237_c0_g1_i1.p2
MLRHTQILSKVENLASEIVKDRRAEIERKMERLRLSTEKDCQFVSLLTRRLRSSALNCSSELGRDLVDIRLLERDAARKVHVLSRSGGDTDESLRAEMTSARWLSDAYLTQIAQLEERLRIVNEI